MATTKTCKALYDARRASILEALESIKEGLDDHQRNFKEDGENNWGYAGDLGHYEEALTRIAKALELNEV